MYAQFIVCDHTIIPYLKKNKTYPIFSAGHTWQVRSKRFHIERHKEISDMTNYIISANILQVWAFYCNCYKNIFNLFCKGGERGVIFDLLCVCIYIYVCPPHYYFYCIRDRLQLTWRLSLVEQDMLTLPTQLSSI